MTTMYISLDIFFQFYASFDWPMYMLFSVREYKTEVQDTLFNDLDRLWLNIHWK